MKIGESRDFVNKDFVKRGLAQEYPFQLILDRFFTEQEKAENADAYESLTPEEWSARCKATSKRIGKEVVGILEMLRKHFKIGQYDPDDSSVTYENCDLWFWCNDTDGARDYSYVTLEPPMAKQSPEDCRHVFQEIRKLLEAYNDTKNVSATICFATRLNEEAVEQEAARIFSKIRNQFVRNGFQIGKVLWVKTTEYTGYVFRKKGCSKLCSISPEAVCEIELLGKSPSDPTEKMDI